MRRTEVRDGSLSFVANTIGFDTSGTFVVPDGVTELHAYALGGGGGGRNDYGAPGRGGSAARSILSVTPGQEITFTVGAGGLGSNAPTAGGDTSIDVGGTLVVGGGGGANNQVGGTSVGQVTAAGGINGNVGASVSGVCGAGSGAYSVNDGLDKWHVGAAGGCFPAGFGGAGATQWGSNPTSMPDGANGYLAQPGGDGGTYGGGGGSGGNYNGVGGDGAGGYAMFSWNAEPPIFADNAWGVAITAQLDSAQWFGISNVTPDMDNAAGDVTFAVSFDNRQTFQVNQGTGWRRIVRRVSTNGAAFAANNTQWQFNAAETYASEAWFSCSDNSVLACLEDAFAHAHNTMPNIEDVPALQWSAAFVNGTLDFAVGLRADASSASPVVHGLDVTLARIPDGLAHCWSGNGNGEDSYGGVTATVYNDVTYRTGVSGQAFGCNGVSGATAGVAATAIPDLTSTGPWTYDFWVRMDSTSGAWVFDRVTGTTPLVSMSVATNGSASWLVRGDAGASATIGGNTLTSTWSHIAIVRGNGFFRTYQNGVEVGSVADTGFAVTPPAPKWCSHAGSANQHMVGEFDTVRIWNRALTATEVAAAADGDGTCEAH
jgi:hypothetical protein